MPACCVHASRRSLAQISETISLEPGAGLQRVFAVLTLRFNIPSHDMMSCSVSAYTHWMRTCRLLTKTWDQEENYRIVLGAELPQTVT